jgi:acetyl esterase/lipase
MRRPVPGGRDTDMVRNVVEPSLTAFLPAPGAGNGAAVIVCPGGGWRLLAWEHEGTEVARWLAVRGYAAFVLQYRLLPTPTDPQTFADRMAAMARRFAEALSAPRSDRLAGLLADDEVRRGRMMAAEDGRRALAVVRARAREWGAHPDRVGMAGFSAGAFLVTDVALEPDGPPMAFAAPIYGGAVAGRPIPADAPALFVAVAEDDAAFAPASRRLADDWTAAGRPAELHVFSRGGHGFGVARQGLPVDRWIDLLGDWLDAVVGGPSP